MLRVFSFVWGEEQGKYGSEQRFENQADLKWNAVFSERKIKTAHIVYPTVITVFWTAECFR